MTRTVIRAGPGHLDLLCPLFRQYRQFYGQAAAASRERAWLEQRLGDGDAVVFLAIDDEMAESAAGFVLLYPTFDSVALGSTWVLHDLFVTPLARRHGTARALMETAHDYCHANGAVRVDLATAVTNRAAKPLYESLGYELDEEFHYYSLRL